jgi:hypothetical protein
MAITLERENIKEILIDLAKQNPIDFKNLIEEVVIDVESDEIEFNEFLKKNFKRFDATFIALA